MTKDEYIAILEMITNYSYEYLKRLDVEALEKLYTERAQ